MTPAVAPTFSRSANWSNGPVPNRTHAFGSAVNTAREDGGIAQYGPLSTSPSAGSPNSGAPNQM